MPKVKTVRDNSTDSPKRVTTRSRTRITSKYQSTTPATASTTPVGRRTRAASRAKSMTPNKKQKKDGIFFFQFYSFTRVVPTTKIP